MIILVVTIWAVRSDRLVDNGVPCTQVACDHPGRHSLDSKALGHLGGQ